MLTLTAALVGVWVGVMATLYWQQVRRRRRMRARIERYSASGWVEEYQRRMNDGSWARWFTSS